MQEVLSIVKPETILAWERGECFLRLLSIGVDT